MRWHDARRRDVVNTATAEKIGRLDGMVVDPDASTIVGVVVGETVVDWADISGVGQDAVTVRNEDLLHLPRSDVERAAVDGSTDPIGKTVITEDGFALGKLSDIAFDADTGAVERLEVSDDDHDVDGARLLGVGSYAVVVASAEQASTSGADNAEQ